MSLQHWVVAVLVTWMVAGVLLAVVIGRAVDLADRRATGRLGRHTRPAGRVERAMPAGDRRREPGDG